MLATLKFVLFNVVLSTTDVATDMLTFFDLLEDNPLWACLTMVWMMMPFLVHTIFFLFKAATGRCKMCTSFTEVMHQFYKEAGIYLPFVSSVHNIWRAKRLFDLKFGTDKFNFKDHKEAEKILDEAGRCSQAESNFEAGPQSVTQVKYFLPHCKIAFRLSLCSVLANIATPRSFPSALLSCLFPGELPGPQEIIVLFHLAIKPPLRQICQLLNKVRLIEV